MTPTQKLIELRIGGDLPGFISRARSEGQSWRQIAADLTKRTGLTVSYETVRTWHQAQDVAA